MPRPFPTRLRVGIVVLPLLLVLGILVTTIVTGGDGEVTGARVDELDPGSPTASSAPTAPTPTPPPPPSPTADPCTPSDAAPLRVVSFNIRSARGPAGVDLDRIAAELRAVHPDVVLLQEVDRNQPRSGGADQAAQLAKALDMGYVYAPMLGRRGGAQYGIATLTRLPFTSHRVMRLPRPGGTEQRGLLSLEITLGERTVSIHNTHLDHSSTAARTRQVTAITRALANDPYPVVLGGDLNSVPGSTVHRTLTRTLRDAWAAAGNGQGLTVPARSPRRRIDYVLIDPRFTTTAAATHPTAVSDHRMLRADLSLSAVPCG